jgi:hypothetical protein
MTLKMQTKTVMALVLLQFIAMAAFLAAADDRRITLSDDALSGIEIVAEPENPMAVVRDYPATELIVNQRESVLEWIEKTGKWVAVKDRYAGSDDHLVIDKIDGWIYSGAVAYK